MKKIMVLAIILIIISLIFEFWVMATYGGKPASEVPLWALWFLFSS